MRDYEGVLRRKEGAGTGDKRRAKGRIAERSELHFSKSKCGQKKIIYKKREEVVRRKKGK